MENGPMYVAGIEKQAVVPDGCWLPQLEAKLPPVQLCNAHSTHHLGLPSVLARIDLLDIADDNWRAGEVRESIHAVTLGDNVSQLTGGLGDHGA